MTRARLSPSWSIAGRLAVTSCLLALAAGCTGDDDTASTTAADTEPVATATVTTTTMSTTMTTTMTRIVTTTPATTEAPSTSTAPTGSGPATTPPTSAAPTTAVPPTTAPPSTGETPPSSLVIVTDPDDPEVAAMLDGFTAHFDAFTRALRDPANKAKTEAAVATTTGQMRRTVERTIEILLERNQAARPDPAFPTRIEVDESSITLGGGAAGFDACWVDGDALVVPGGNADGSDQVIESGVESDQVSYGMSMVDGKWLVSSIDFFQSFEGQDRCV